MILALASAGAAAVGLNLAEEPNDLVKLAYSSKPLNEIRPEQKRLYIELIRRKDQNSRDYGRVAASTKPIVPALYSVTPNVIR